MKSAGLNDLEMIKKPHALKIKVVDCRPVVFDHIYIYIYIYINVIKHIIVINLKINLYISLMHHPKLLVSTRHKT